MRPRRWFAHRFLTRSSPAPYNRNSGRVISATDKPFDLVPGVEVSRPNWWEWGSWSGVTAETYEEARERLDAWQDEMAARHDKTEPTSEESK